MQKSDVSSHRYNILRLKIENNTFNNFLRSKRFSGFTFIRNAQSQTFEIRRCRSTETVEELYVKNT